MQQFQDRGTLFQGGRVMGFGAGVDDERSPASPMALIDGRCYPVNISGGIRAREGGPQEVTANREMINELINNLCANAIRYNKKNGTVKVRVDSEQGHPYLRVEDTGIGIPKEHQK